MKRHIPGLQQQTRAGTTDEIPEGVFLVRVDRASYRWHPQKPFFVLSFGVLEPDPFTGRTLGGRLYCTPRALWKLGWFLRDFGYDTDLLGREEVDDRALVGLRGVVRVSYSRVNGQTYRNLEGFASVAAWDELSSQAKENGNDL